MEKKNMINETTTDLKHAVQQLSQQVDSILKLLDESVILPAKRTCKPLDRCPYCKSDSLTRTSVVTIRCLNCNVEFLMHTLQTPDEDVVSASEIEQNSSILQPIDFFVCLFSVIGKSTKTITFRHARRIRDKVTELMLFNIHIPWTRNEIYNTLNMSPDMFEIDGRNAAVNWVGSSCVDAWNAIKDLQLYSEEIVYDLEEAMEKAIDVVGAVHIS